ncbi:MAG: guanylate kinase [Tepidanaerobacteraceae bacterium]
MTKLKTPDNVAKTQEKGILFVVSGPSGAGKGTICGLLMQKIDNLSVSISATTRAPRQGEVDGVSYFFLERSEFERKIERDEFLEWAKVYNNYYGTPKDFVEGQLNAGKDVILEIDVQGASKIKRCCPDGVYIFIFPPSIKELKNRIIKRGSETIESIRERMKYASQELKLASSYDYIVLNDELEKAVAQLKSIIIAERCRANRNLELIRKVERGKLL